jgi:hypothetical protein
MIDRGADVSNCDLDTKTRTITAVEKRRASYES